MTAQTLRRRQCAYADARRERALEAGAKPALAQGDGDCALCGRHIDREPTQTKENT